MPRTVKPYFIQYQICYIGKEEISATVQIFVLLKSRKLSQSETLREKPECVFVYLRLGHFLQLLELVEIEGFGPA